MNILRCYSVALCATMLASVPISASSTTGQPNYCRVTPQRSDALDWPSKHAWDLFMVVNQPAVDRKIARGKPDCAKPIGTPGTTTTWETWRNAGSEVYLSDGAEPPPWDDTSLPDEKPGQVPAAAASAAAAVDPTAVISVHDMAMLARSGQKITPQFSPGDGVFKDSGGFGETRLNRATYEFVRRECLYSREGQQRYANAYEEGKKPPITFPTDAIEVKAAWLDFEKEKIDPAKQQTYYTAVYQGKKYGLVTLHIFTKDLPSWFWASFHHKDAPDNKANESGDSYGRPRDLDGTVWANYVLGGTQTDFTEPNGKPTVLSDYYVEYQFQRSSCMTCHATASISKDTPMPSAQLKALCAMTPNLPDFGLDPAQCKTLIGAKWFGAGTDTLIAERGAPDPDWFKKNGVPTFLQTDFVWSIPFRGKHETSPPPARCNW